ncbi:unnamed protein product, partial [marine sediment metagenome]
MKTNRKTIVLILLGTLFALPLLNNANFSYFGGNNSENLDTGTEPNLKRAG